MRVLSAESERLILICGLGWPEVTRYYLAHRWRDLWEFWEQPAGHRQARRIFAWVDNRYQAETEVAKRMLGDYLGAFRAGEVPSGETLQGLLSLREIERILRRQGVGDGSTLNDSAVSPRPDDPPAA